MKKSISVLLVVCACLIFVPSSFGASKQELKHQLTVVKQQRNAAIADRNTINKERNLYASVTVAFYKVMAGISNHDINFSEFRTLTNEIIDQSGLNFPHL